jgi:hypothetical protein
VKRSVFVGLVLLLLCIGGLVFTGWWHAITLNFWRQPMLSWFPLVAGAIAGYAVGAVLSRRRRLHGGTFLAAAAILYLAGIGQTLFFQSTALVDDFDHFTAATLPASTQPRLLPRAGVRDDPQFADSKEIHLARDPSTGGLIWTGEWQASFVGGESHGVAVERLDKIVEGSHVVQGGFEHSVAGFAPGTAKYKAKLKHPLSAISYPVIVPTGEDEAVAVMSYLGYRGFPFPHPYFKGVMVYHQDGTLEDLTPEEAAARPELSRSARIFPETLARKQADALARSIDGDIDDGKGNKQPFLTALDRDRTVWLTIINEQHAQEGVKALVLADAVTGETRIWKPPEGEHLISTREVYDDARSLPLQWTATRCCDSDGHSYTVTLREVVEPRLAFKDGQPYYMVTVVPTRELALSRRVEYTLLIDARTGRKLDEFRHDSGGPSEDARLQKFFDSD